MGLTFEFIHNGEVLATSNELPQATSTNITGNIIIAGNGNDKFIETIKDAISELVDKSETGRKLLNVLFIELKKRKKGVIIYPEKKSKVNADLGNTYLLGFNPEIKKFDAPNGRGHESLDAPITTTLAHELEHVRQYMLLHPQTINLLCVDKIPKENQIYAAIEYCEVLAVEVENSIRNELDIKIRTHYGNVEIYNESGDNFKTYSKEQEIGKDVVWGEESDKVYVFRRLKKDEIQNIRFADMFNGRVLASRLLIKKNEPNVILSASSTIKINFISNKMKNKIDLTTATGEKIVIDKDKKTAILECK